MFEIAKITLKGIGRDRIFQGIMALGVIFLFIPSVASLSMRQVTELAITLSLSLISFILLLLSVFLGATLIWRDIERRYTFSVLSLPVHRSEYLLGRFLGVSLFLVGVTIFLGTGALLVVKVASGIYPPAKPVAWGIIMASLGFDALKYILLVAFALLLSTFSTSFFLPIFGTLCAYFAGTITQQVHEFIHSPAGAKTISSTGKILATAAYYLLPNLSSLDLKVNAIYGIDLNLRGLLLTGMYTFVYIAMLLVVASLIFSNREMK